MASLSPLPEDAREQLRRAELACIRGTAVLQDCRKLLLDCARTAERLSALLQCFRQGTHGALQQSRE
jgi:hypothetical protein